jgi:hypothetical protein
MNQQTVQQFNHNVLDGEPKIVFDRPAQIKLSNAPKIVFAMPIGGKKTAVLFKCDNCKEEYAEVPAYMVPNLVPVQTMLNYHQLQMPLNVTTSFLVEAGRLSAEARQIMTKKAIRMGAQYIIYWDDDVLVPADAVKRMYNFMEKNPEVGVTGAVCTTRQDPAEPVVYRTHGDGACWDFEAGEGAIPEPVLGVGSGFMMARVSAITDIIAKLTVDNNGAEVPVWADETVFKPHEDQTRGINVRELFWGHDVRFCRLMQEAGYHVCVHGAVLCGHLDIVTGIIYGLPEDAPGFKKVQARLNGGKQEEHVQGEEGHEGVPAGSAALGQ